MRNSSKARATLYFQTVLFIILFVFSFNKLLNYSRIYNAGTSCEATVTYIEPGSYLNPGQTNFKGTALYTDANGELHEYYGYLGIGAQLKEKITLYYDPEHPEKAVTKSNTWLLASIASGIFCLIFAAGSVFNAYSNAVVKEVRCEHYMASSDEICDIIRRNMPQTIERFSRGKKKNSFIDKPNIDPTLDHMIHLGNDSLGGIYKAHKQLFKNGQIYLGAVIMPFDNDAYKRLLPSDDERIFKGEALKVVPAYMVYSTDDRFLSNPGELKQIASAFENGLFGAELTPHESSLLRLMRSTQARPFNMRYNGVLSGFKEVYVTTVILDKAKLCDQRLTNRLLYLVADPQNTEFAEILPAWYYSKEELSAF